MAVLSTLMVLVVPSISSVSQGQQFGRNVHDLAGLLRQARTTAMAQNTFIWLGFHEEVANGVPMLTVTAVSAKSGRKLDLADQNYAPMMRPVTFQNVSFDPSGYLSLNGIDRENNVDVSKSQYSFSQNLPGRSQVKFTPAIVFTPTGEAGIEAAAVARCVGLGLVSGSAQKAAVQVSGLSGKIAVYRQ